MDVCMKKVKEEDWRTFKAEAAIHGMKLGEFFGYLVKKYIKNNLTKIYFFFIFTFIILFVSIFSKN